MLILPLHRPLTRGSLPWATALLVLINVFVHVVLQSGDEAILKRAMQQYVSSGLGSIEEPLYREYVAEHGSARTRRELSRLGGAPEPFRQAVLAQLIDLDFPFQARLAAGGAGLEDGELERWRGLRADYERLREHSVTWRYMHRGNEFDPVRMIGAAFLHGSLGHLLGNMLFLVLLGLLVESALGPWRHLALYLVGAFGASAASLAWHWGTPAAGLGASGAVAAIMGAYCVLWGMRKVRFFYWFFVIFDYVRAPAIWLLPAWLGWEVFQLLTAEDARIGFDAHAGGLVTGAGFALLMRQMGWCAPGFLDAEDEEDAADVEGRVREALAHLGRMELAQAEALLAEVEAVAPGRPDVALARYRCARYAGRSAQAAERLAGLLAERSPVGLEDRRKALEDASTHGVRLPPEGVSLTVRALLERQRFEDAVTLLDALPSDFDEAVQARLWFQLALARQDRPGDAGARQALGTLLQRFPASTEAGKARFLLDGGPG